MSILNRQAREYNVLLHDDAFSDPCWRQYAMNVLFQVFENCTIDNAMQAILVRCRSSFCNYRLSATCDTISSTFFQACSFKKQRRAACISLAYALPLCICKGWSPLRVHVMCQAGAIRSNGIVSSFQCGYVHLLCTSHKCRQNSLVYQTNAQAECKPGPWHMQDKCFGPNVTTTPCIVLHEAECTLDLSGHVGLCRPAVRQAYDQSLIHSDCCHVLTIIRYAACTHAWSGVPHHLPQKGSRTILEGLDRPEASLYHQEAGRTHPDSTYKSHEARFWRWHRPAEAAKQLSPAQRRELSVSIECHQLAPGGNRTPFRSGQISYS